MAAYRRDNIIRLSVMHDLLKEQFEQDGYVLGLELLNNTQVARYRRAYERIEKEVSLRNPKGRITNMHLEDAEIWELATHPRVLEWVGSIVGADIVLVSSGFFVKPPESTGQFVAWHQDTTYWGLEPPFAITAWIALDDADVENGCMRVIPGSHKLGLLPHCESKQQGNVLGQNQEIDLAQFDASTAVDFVLKAGSASLHHGELIHGSNPNCSRRRRCGMTVRFSIPAVRPVKTGEYPFRDRPVLVCGEDRYGHFEYVPKPDFA